MKHILLSSSDVDLENIKTERKAIRENLSKVLGKFVHITSLHDMTFSALFDAIEKDLNKDTQPIEFLHYCGHSSRHGIVGTAIASDHQLISTEDFANFLGKYEDLKVVFLNSCSSKYIGQALIDSGNVEIVIETHDPVYDSDALIFSEAFYLCLANGDTIKEAFESAKLKLINTETHLRGKKRDFLDDETEPADGFSWQLTDKENKATNWRLFHPFGEGEPDDSKVKVLSLFPNPADSENKKFHEALKSAFIEVTDDKAEVLSYPELITQGKGLKETLLLFDSVVIFCGDGFKNFWNNHLNEVKEELKECRIGLLNCIGEDSVKKVKDLLKENKIPFFIEEEIPEGAMHLSMFKMLNQSLVVTLTSKLCIDAITKLGTKKDQITPAIIKSALKENIPDLNFDLQKGQFTKNDKFSPFNLFLIEGTNECAHEFLVKQIFRLAGEGVTPSSVGSKIMKISISNELEAKTVWKSIQDYFMDVSFALPPAQVREMILGIMKTKNVILLIKNSHNSTEFIKVINGMWEIFKGISEDQKPEKKLFFFALNETGDFEKDEEAIKSLSKSDDKFRTEIFTPIKPLEKDTFEEWFLKNSLASKIKKDKRYKSLKADKKMVLQNAHMAPVIGALCKTLRMF